MQELGTDGLKLRTKPHEELVHAEEVTVLGSGVALSASRTRGRRHLIALAPKVSKLRKELLNGAVTLVADAKGLKQ